MDKTDHLKDQAASAASTGAPDLGQTMSLAELAPQLQASAALGAPYLLPPSLCASLFYAMTSGQPMMGGADSPVDARERESALPPLGDSSLADQLIALCASFGWRTDGDASMLIERIAHHVRQLRASTKAHVGVTATEEVTTGAVPPHDTQRIDFIDEMIHDHGAVSVWFLPCGPDLRFVQIRTPGHCHNGPTVSTLRSAIDAVREQRKT
jgi:hypothetical protein